MKNNKLTPAQFKLKEVLKPIVKSILNENESLPPISHDEFVKLPPVEKGGGWPGETILVLVGKGKYQRGEIIYKGNKTYTVRLQNGKIGKVSHKDTKSV